MSVERSSEIFIPEVRAGLNYEQIGQLKEPLTLILEQMRSQIANHEYGIIIGDDTSGRIPTLILSRVINSIYNFQGENPAIVTFAQGSSDKDYYYAMATHLIEKTRRFREKNEKKEKALLVTEFLGKGECVNTFIEILKNMKVTTDVAAVESFYPKELYHHQKAVPVNSALFIGKENSRTGSNLICDFPHTGLNQKKYTDNKFIMDPGVRANARAALKDSRILADEL